MNNTDVTGQPEEGLESNIYGIIIQLFRIQYKTAIAEACDYFLNSTLDDIARWKI